MPVIKSDPQTRLETATNALSAIQDLCFEITSVDIGSGLSELRADNLGCLLTIILDEMRDSQEGLERERIALNIDLLIEKFANRSLKVPPRFLGDRSGWPLHMMDAGARELREMLHSLPEAGGPAGEQ